MMSQYEFRKTITLAWVDPKNYWKSDNEKRTNDEANDNDTITTRSKNKRKRRALARLMITSNLMEACPIECQDLWNMN